MDRQDNRQSTDEKVTISVAAKALKVSTKTVHRYIEKGLLTKLKEGTRVYVPMDDIRVLRNGQGSIDKSPPVHEKDRIIIDRGHYDGLLIRVGQLESERQLLLEYKASIEEKDKVILEQKEKVAAQNKILREAKEKIEAKEEELAEIRAREEEKEKELKRLKKRSFFQRLFNR
jgi:DNA-binding transcriptional MerR regulator